MGFSIVHELAERGIQVLAFTRNREKLERLFVNQKNIQIVTGDALMDSGLFNILRSSSLYFSKRKMVPSNRVCLEPILTIHSPLLKAADVQFFWI